MHFQIFIPGQRGADPRHLEAVGLAGFTAGAMFLDTDGPGGEPGVLVSWSAKGPPRLAYRPDQQTWRPALPIDGWPAGRYWLGVWTDALPGPGDLRRPYQELGESLALGDGNEWLVPIVRELPKEHIRDDDGSWKFVVQREFHALWMESRGWIRRFAAAEGRDVSIDLGEITGFCERALAVNYRITPELCSELRLWNTRSVKLALCAAIPELLALIMEGRHGE